MDVNILSFFLMHPYACLIIINGHDYVVMLLN